MKVLKAFACLLWIFNFVLNDTQRNKVQVTVELLVVFTALAMGMGD